MVIAGLIVVIGTAASGASGFLLTASAVAFWTALYCLITGRRSWALLPSRKAAGIVLGAALALTVVSGAIAKPDTREDPVAQFADAPDTEEAESPRSSPSPTPTRTPSPTQTRTTAPSPTQTQAPPSTVTPPADTPLPIAAPPAEPEPPPAPVAEEPPAPPAAPAEPSGCDPNYAGACVPIASDVDCAGGSGNGPAYVSGPVQVVGSDIYDLDRDGDGWACDT